jgi:NAD(P)H-dependent FMN reductase
MNTDKPAGSAIRILGLIGSQRKLGNCELFVKEVARNVSQEHDLRLIRLPSLDVRPCNGCYHCVSEGTCRIEDDIPFVIREIVSSDALIIAAPVYFLGAHASVKSLLDRAFSFFGALDGTQGKPCVLVNMYGMRDRIGVAPQTLLSLASFLGLRVKASVNLQAALPGDVIANRNHLRSAARLANLLLTGGAMHRLRRSCPFCGNDVVRMGKKDFTCTLCHGSFLLNEHGTPTKSREGWQVGNIDFIRAHREWLKGMKTRFLRRKREIIARSLPYKDMGTWIEPDK